MDVLSFVLALAPILWLVAVLLVLKWPAWRAAAGSLVIACLLAATWWALPIDNVATAALEGFLMALWPIVVVIIAAVFTYNLCVRTGAMDTISRMITSISSDRRILALLVAWCFGGFMEGMAGFGTAVAIPAGMLAALGYAPLPAVLMCLLANGVPTPYGSIGIPTVSLADLVGLDASSLAFTQMIQLAPFFIVAPFLIVAVAGKGAGSAAGAPSLAERFRGVSLVALAAGVSFTAPALLVAAFVGPELTVVVGSICSLGVTAALARRGFFEREHLWHYRRLGAMLQALPDFRRIPGLDAPCLTVQPSLATAAALAEGLARRSFRPRVVFLVSERAFRSEEFAEEAARVAGEPLPNLFMIVASKDGFELPRRACSGWDCREAAADDFASLESACASFDFSSGGPKALFAAARGGSGLSLFGEEPADGGHSLSLGELDQALEELEVRSNEHK